MNSLPIDAVLPALRTALQQRHEAVLEAPPGAGKTTRVPLALLDEPWLAGQRILMLEPRRLAARAAAERLASELGEAVGETVGYRIRLDSKVGPRTRIEVVTEGILTRRLQDDPALDGVGLLIFDEFHERSLDADLALALSLNVRELLRDEPPLKILLMSATLEGQRLSALLDDAPVISSEGRMYPVQMRWGGRSSPASSSSRGWSTRCCRRWPTSRAACWCSCLARPRSAVCTRPCRRPWVSDARSCCARCTVNSISRPSAPPSSAGRGPAQGGAGDQHRRNQPDHRRRAGGDRRRAGAGAAF